MVQDLRTKVDQLALADQIGSGIGSFFGARVAEKELQKERQQKAFLEQWEQEKTSALVGVMHDPNLTTEQQHAKLRGIPEMTKSKAYQKVVLGGKFDENPMEEYYYWTGIKKVAEDSFDEEGVARADFNLERIYKKFPSYNAYQKSKIPATAADLDPDNPSPLPQDRYEQVMRDVQANGTQKVQQAHPSARGEMRQDFVGPVKSGSPIDVEIEQIVGPPEDPLRKAVRKHEQEQPGLARRASPEFVGPQQRSGQKSPYKEYPDAFLEGGVWKVMKNGKKYKILDD